MYGRILSNGLRSDKGWYHGLPFAIVEASCARPRAGLGEITGYRYFYHEPGTNCTKSYSPIASPLAAYCWVPGVFLDFPPPGVGPRTLLDFVAAGASFVVVALRKLATYIHEQSSRFKGHEKMEWTRCRAHDALGQIAAALDLSDGENKVVVMPKERRADFRVGCPKAVRASVSWRPGQRVVGGTSL